MHSDFYEITKSETSLLFADKYKGFTWIREHLYRFASKVCMILITNLPRDSSLSDNKITSCRDNRTANARGCFE